MNTEKENKTYLTTHKDEIVRDVVNYVAIGTAIACGYVIGKRMTEFKISCGIEKMFNIMPELKPMYYEALKKLKDTAKG